MSTCSDGIWINGEFNLCYQDCGFQPILLIALLLLLPNRIASLRNQRSRVPPTSRMKILLFIELGVSFFIALLRFMILISDVDDLTPCLTAGDVTSMFSWIIITILLTIETRRFELPNRFERLAWFYAFVVSIVRFVSDISHIQYEIGSSGTSCTTTGCQTAVALRILSFPFYSVIGLCGLFQQDSSIKTSKSSYLSRGSTMGQDDREMLSVGQQQEEEGGNQIYRVDGYSLFSQFSFSWLNPLLKFGSKNPLDFQHMNSLDEIDTTQYNSDKLQAAWDKFGKGKHHKLFSFHRTLHYAFGPYFWYSAFYKVVNDLGVVAGPVLLNLIVTFLEEGRGPAWQGYILTLAMLIAAEIQSVAIGQYFFRGYRQALWIRAAICSLVYKKSLVISYRSKNKFGLGKIVSLMQIDAQKIADAAPYLHLTWSAPLQLAISLYILYLQVEVAGFAGLFVLIIFMPLNSYVARKQAALTKKTMEARDARVKLVNEILSGIRIVKMFGWEQSYMDRIGELREQELKWIRSNSIWGAFSAFLWGATPLLVAISTFFVFVMLGNTLTAAKAFTSLALFNALRFPLNALPGVITNWIEIWVSSKRIREFLLAEEVVQHTVTTQNADVPPPNDIKCIRFLTEEYPSWIKSTPLANEDFAVVLSNLTISWPKPDNDVSKNIVLKGVNMNVKKREVVYLVGEVGSGKSSLLSAILNEIDIDEGSVWTRGTIAYCSQQAWIKNATLKDNILFGQLLDESWYNQVVEACALKPDLEMLPAGDATEIGERGINLSGGQKQRVALARACYANASIYILDDILSAVDVHVGNHLVQHCINGLLKDKTRIIATHQIHWLQPEDQVLVLQDQLVQHQGSYQQLVANGVDFGPLAVDNKKQEEKSEKKPEKASKKEEKKSEGNKPAGGPPNKKDGEIIAKEERKTGFVALKIWKTYAAALGLKVFIVLCFFYFLSQTLQISSSIWLSVWSTATTGSSGYYLAVYSALSLTALSVMYFRSLTNALASVRAGKRIHDSVVWKVLRSPVSFFDTTPLGRIINRLSSDQQVVDVQMRMTTQMLLNMMFGFVGAVGTILYATPFVIFFLAPAGFIYRKMQNMYRASGRELQRLESISKSPIYVAFSETLNGSTTIRAFHRESNCIEDSLAKIDKNIRVALPAQAANRWLAIRLEFLGAVIASCAAFMAILQFNLRGSAAGLAGLSISFALEITGVLNWLIRMFTTAEIQMVAVERLMEWEQLPSEGNLGEINSSLTPNWPTQGKIVFENVSMRYRPNLPLVLNKLSFTINPGERIGVVGRTGSGKSSLLLTLFRMVDIELDGNILIDGINLRSIGLHDLRKRISIIPQDPTLFSGSLRYNLDPFDQYTDQQIWQSLDRCSLSDFVKSKEDGLKMKIEPGGENLSVGQRQLVCLARALLRASRILVLDEATASIDGKTDVLIQETLKNNLNDCTVITIAHRIHTVINSDRILVMSGGHVAEFDNPQTLLANTNSEFYQLVNGSNTEDNSL